METISSIFGGAIGAAIVAGIFSLIQWRLNRKANKEDRAEEKADMKDSTITDIVKQLQKMDEKIDSLESKIEVQNIVNKRTNILRFGDELAHGTLHSRENFRQILSDIDEYEEYCAKHPDFKNHITVHTTEKIIEIYKKCDRENSFLF